MSKSAQNLEAKRRHRFAGAVGNPNFFNYLGFDYDLYSSIFRHSFRAVGKMSNSKAGCKRRRKVVFSDFR